MVETPEDPMTYRQDEVEYASFTVWPEVQSVLEKAVGLTRLTVDQGAPGHQRRKPNMLVEQHGRHQGAGWPEG